MSRALTILLLLALQCSAAVRYVRTDGNNANDGTANDAAHAWLTIVYAESQLAAGDTVYVADGTYNERVTIDASGSAGNFINYVGNATGTGVVMYGFALSGVSYVRLIGFEIRHTSTTYEHGIYLSGTCNYIEIIDNYIHDTHNRAVSADDATTRYIKIRGNHIYYTAHPGELRTSTEAIVSAYPNNAYWLIEYNNIHRTMDFIDVYGTNNVFRNNELHDFDGSYWTVYGHSDGFQTGSDSGNSGTKHQLVERNILYDSLDIDSHFGIWHDTVNAGDTNILIRGNIGREIGGGGTADIGTDKMLIYHNTFSGMMPTYEGGVFVWYSYGSQGSILKNNVIDDDGASEDAIGIDVGHTVDQGYNLGYNAGSESSYVSTSDPDFVNRAALDFRPKVGSPCINAGTSVATITTASGSGTSFDVNDGQLFRDGNGLVEGDVVTVGSTTTRITSISDNTVTVAASVTWTQNDPIYWGTDTTPDIGAIPYGSTLLSAATYSTNGTTYTVTTTGDARGVWFYVDGIPTTWDYDAPYQQTIASGTVTMKAYALWAQTNPVVNATYSASAAGSGSIYSGRVVAGKVSGGQ